MALGEDSMMMTHLLCSVVMMSVEHPTAFSIPVRTTTGYLSGCHQGMNLHFLKKRYDINHLLYKVV